MPAVIPLLPNIPAPKPMPAAPSKAAQEDSGPTSFEQTLSQVKTKVKEASPQQQEPAPAAQAKPAEQPKGKAGKKTGKAGKGEEGGDQVDGASADQGENEDTVQSQGQTVAAEVAAAPPETPVIQEAPPEKHAPSEKTLPIEAALAQGAASQAMPKPIQAELTSDESPTPKTSERATTVKELRPQPASEPKQALSSDTQQPPLAEEAGDVAADMKMAHVLPAKPPRAKVTDGERPSDQVAQKLEAAAVEQPVAPQRPEVDEHPVVAQTPRIAEPPKQEKRTTSLPADEALQAGQAVKKPAASAARLRETASAQADAVEAADAAVEPPPVDDKPDGNKPDLRLDARQPLERPASVLFDAPPAVPPQHASAPKSAAAPPPLPPEASFVETNHGRIITGIRTELLPNGGTMQIRLDPPELGALQVSIEMRDGVVSASFQTSSDDATRLLSHSLHQLKQTLESQGVSVEKLQVQQAPREKHGGLGDSGQQAQGRDQPAQQEQQRREMLNRMWRRLRGDPLDVLG